MGYADADPPPELTKSCTVGRTAFPIAGRICMDQCLVDVGITRCGRRSRSPGQTGEEEITADERAH